MEILDYAPRHRKRRRSSRGIGTAIAVLLCYAIVLIGAGHGAAPVGLIMYWIAAPETAAAWKMPAGLGWAGAAMLALSCLVRPVRPHFWARLGAGLVLFMGWLMFIGQSEVLVVTLVTSIPLAIAACCDAARLFRQLGINSNGKS
jgi:hypothetical protein